MLYYPSGSNVPTRVLGQKNRFYNYNQFNPPTAADSLSLPWGLAVDSSDGVYVADSQNNRVLYFPAGSTTATRVYGQGGSFTSSLENNGGISVNSLRFPKAVAVNALGVYIADNGNNRVLFYAGSSTIASRVYGQGGSFTSNLVNNGGISANSLNNPYSLALDPSGNLYVADSINSRALFYSGVSTTASRVYGQGGSFTTNSAGGVTADGLNGAFGITVDATGVYITDGFRMLYYSGVSTTATRVYGQTDFTSFIPNNGGVSATSLSFVLAAKAGGGGLYVADNSNHRVLFYSGNSTTASRVYGQNNNFSKTGIDNAITAANNLYRPKAVKPDGAGGVYIADYFNNRVLHYPSGTSTADRVYGQSGNFTTNLGVNQTGVSANSLYNPEALAVDSTGSLYIADRSWNRVLYYSVGSIIPSRVYGQPDFNSNGSNNGGIGPNTLSSPTGLALDNQGGLFVADSYNYRVLHYPSGNTTPDRVYGQPDFTSAVSNNGGISATSLTEPQDLTVDSATNDLYITDFSNNRVLVYSGTNTTANQVFGQFGNFTTNFLNELSNPLGVALSADGAFVSNDYGAVAFYPNKDPNPANDKFIGNFINADGYYANPSQLRQNVQSAKIATDASGNLYIADQGNNRVVVYHKANPASDFINNFYPVFDQVYGQGGSFTSKQSSYQPPTLASLNAPEASIVDDTGGTVTRLTIGCYIIPPPAPPLTGFMDRRAVLLAGRATMAGSVPPV